MQQEAGERAMSGLILPFKGKWPKIAEDCFIAPNATIIGDVEIGPGSSVWFGTVLRGDYGAIRVGAKCSIQDNAVLHVFHTETSSHPTVLHDGVTIGHGAVIEGSEICERSLVGMNAVILPLCKIGPRSIVGAGAVVTTGQEFPEKSLIAGAPAKFKRELSEEAASGNDFSISEYSRLAQEYRAEMADLDAKKSA
jgi:carbonic anhydrase/acetyltransferase-like protein (isoleucine patch superfamily)